MKTYTLEAILNGQTQKIRKTFKSRLAAINYMFEFLDKSYIFNKEINEEYSLNNNKHDVLYVCDDYTRFRVTRVG